MANDSGGSGELAPIFDDDQAEEHIRHVRHNGRWFFSIIDVVGLLTGTQRPRKYWSDLKAKLEAEGAQLSEKIGQLKMPAPDGKQRITDAADAETMLRIVESISSPKAERVKRFLARVGAERLEEMENPALAADRMRREYQRLGYSDAWIRERLKNIVIRDELTAEWAERGADERRDFARLTDTLSRGTFDITTAQHKAVKGLRGNTNLRDSMTPLELALTSLAEVTATELHQTRDSHGVGELQTDAKDAGTVAGNARREVEALTQKPVVSPTNYKTLRQGRRDELQPRLLDSPGGEGE